MSFKKSMFNYIYRRKNGENVIYNTFSKGLITLDDNEIEQYNHQLFTNNGVERELINNGILIKNDFDEISFLKYFHYKTKFSNNILYLTIAPTLDCNFGCPYCYENRRTGNMSQEVQRETINYIKEMIESGVTDIHLTWYGGEPLLYFDIVENMTKQIIQLTTKNKCRLKLEMVTNGYLLTKEIVDKLDEFGFSRIQITIDGLKENHDKRRHLISGKGTYDRIMSNLYLFDDSSMNIFIRMNIDNENSRDFKILKQEIEAIENDSIKVYASPVEDLNKDKINNVSKFMSNKEFDAFTLQSYDDETIDTDELTVMDDRYCFCTAEIENCYVIDEKGDFYKCWDQVGRKEYVCFNVLDRVDKNYSNISKYLVFDPFEDERCSKCVFLPACFGGCKFQRYVLNKSVCGFTDETIQKYLETTFFEN